MSTHLEPDILECEVKWALESITTNKASAGDGIPVEQFQILKDDAVKVLYSICQQLWKTQQWPQDWKRSVFIPIPKKGNAKELSNYRTIAFISHASKVMLKILQARLQQYVNRELPDVQAGFRKGRGTRDQIANIQNLDHRKSKRVPKNIYFCLKLTPLNICLHKHITYLCLLKLLINFMCSLNFANLLYDLLLEKRQIQGEQTKLN